MKRLSIIYLFSAVIAVNQARANGPVSPRYNLGDKVKKRPLNLPKGLTASPRLAAGVAPGAGGITVVNAADGTQNINYGQIVAVYGLPSGTWVSTTANYVADDGTVAGTSETAGISQATDHLYVVLPSQPTSNLGDGHTPYRRMSLSFTYLFPCDAADPAQYCISAYGPTTEPFDLSGQSTGIFVDGNGHTQGTITVTEANGVQTQYPANNLGSPVVIPTNAKSVTLTMWLTGASALVDAVNAGCSQSSGPVSSGYVSGTVPYQVNCDPPNTATVAASIVYAGATSFPGLQQVNLDLTPAWQAGVLGATEGVSVSIATGDCLYVPASSRPTSLPFFLTPGHTLPSGGCNDINPDLVKIGTANGH